MSEQTVETTPQKPIRAEVYKENEKVTVELPVDYVVRFNQMLLEFIPFKDQEHFLETMKKIGQGTIDDPFTYHCQTVLAFLTLVESAAREQDKLHWVEYNPETQEKTPVDGPLPAESTEETPNVD